MIDVRDHTMVTFCVLCFSSEEPEGHCMNCGANGSTVGLPRWAVDDVRKNASWNGRRKWPNDEDRDAAAELRWLRTTVARRAPDLCEGRVVDDGDRPGLTRAPSPGNWVVHQQQPGGLWTQTSVAKLPGEAYEQAKLRTAHLLPVNPFAWTTLVDDVHGL